MEKRIPQVLKALANSLDMTLGDLLEGIVLHAFQGKAPFSPGTLEKFRTLRSVYDLDLEAADSHELTVRRCRPGARPGNGGNPTFLPTTPSWNRSPVTTSTSSGWLANRRTASSP